ENGHCGNGESGYSEIHSFPPFAAGSLQQYNRVFVWYLLAYILRIRISNVNKNISIIDNYTRTHILASTVRGPYNGKREAFKKRA
ncbi:MAG: hypothetical protein Q4G57_07240, partial [Bacillota bacterium]|nr:hypothetical protein [Bacillota bacterium]